MGRRSNRVWKRRVELFRMWAASKAPHGRSKMQEMITLYGLKLLRRLNRYDHVQ